MGMPYKHKSKKVPKLDTKIFHKFLIAYNFDYLKFNMHLIIQRNSYDD